MNEFQELVSEIVTEFTECTDNEKMNYDLYGTEQYKKMILNGWTNRTEIIHLRIQIDNVKNSLKGLYSEFAEYLY